MTKVVAKDIGERIFIDISSVDHKAYDGARYWVLVVDDKTNKSWSFFVGHKDQQVDPLFELLLLLYKNKTPVKYIRADNAGENMLLQEAIRNHHFLNAKFEFTPQNSPEYNGRCERKFAFLWSCLRSILNATKLPDTLKKGLWTSAARYAKLISNSLVTKHKKDIGCSYSQFHKKAWDLFPNLRPFGTMAVVTTKEPIQSKLDQKGTLMIYVGPALNHARMLRSYQPDYTEVCGVTEMLFE